MFQALDNKEDVENLRHRNEKLMQNILPAHVIDDFLQIDNKDETVCTNQYLSS